MRTDDNEISLARAFRGMILGISIAQKMITNKNNVIIIHHNDLLSYLLGKTLNICALV